MTSPKEKPPETPRQEIVWDKTPWPAGDVRLTVNIKRDAHFALKMLATKERVTMGELIERWIAEHATDLNKR